MWRPDHPVQSPVHAQRWRHTPPTSGSRGKEDSGYNQQGCVTPSSCVPAVADAQARSPHHPHPQPTLPLPFYLPLSSAAAPAPCPCSQLLLVGGANSVPSWMLLRSPGPLLHVLGASLVLPKREDPILGGSAYEQYFNNGV